ncbi:F0F1 ATP synthase subunit A [Lacticaseibacillus nasuensis]|uniref:F0F1 ATP synthase subunit A n=1 Tax=Lacticaseibacillus nasuensis TaxID=944671 RepID=UPI000704A782|nr:F0F1 ATP synthase subunit A [Lacticaseibacillus nasuensis]MCX2455514.1 F0F1 ATP synthase subunit A [Lacticaseibacillus nasuensis]
MKESFPYFELFGVKFNPANDIAIIVSAILTFCLLYWLARKPQLRPHGKQNVLEYLIEFTNGIVKGAMPGSEGSQFGLFALVLFVFIFINNQIGLIFQVDVNGDTWFRSATADPVITLGLAMIVLVMSHFFGVAANGFKGYLKGFASPVAFLLPINLIEEFTNFVTLSLRLYGNIYAGEVLLLLIRQLAFSGGPLALVSGFLLEIIWQGFSVFIGSIQAYIFVTLGMVYTSHKVISE